MRVTGLARPTPRVRASAHRGVRLGGGSAARSSARRSFACLRLVVVTIADFAAGTGSVGLRALAGDEAAVGLVIDRRRLSVSARSPAPRARPPSATGAEACSGSHPAAHKNSSAIMTAAPRQLSPQMTTVTTFTGRRGVVAELRLVPGALTVALALRPAVTRATRPPSEEDRPRLPMFRHGG